MPKTSTANRPLQDWHPWDIKAALGKKGYSLSRVALENGYCKTSPSECLRKQWPQMERVIADIIGVAPWSIWPTRYDENHEPLRMHGTCRTY